MKTRKFRYFVGDFETTVYDGQEDTQVWASAVVEYYTEDVKIFHSIDETFKYFLSLKDNICIYYHNLKFDGAFWLSYLLVDLGLEQATYKINNNSEYALKFDEDEVMLNKTFKYCISDMGQWYNIKIKWNNKIIEIRDSLKLLPFSVKDIGKYFDTKHKKLDMEYKGFRYSGCEITAKEKEYIANDVLVVKEGLEILQQEQHSGLTIGSCCLTEYRRIIGKEYYYHYFPDLEQILLNENEFGSKNADQYIRKSYKGGWCYLVKGKERKKLTNGFTADVNSLYPSMMHSESGNKYPIGEPTFWKGDYIPDEALENDKYYFIRIKTRFYIKENKLPCIQIKGNLLYKSTDWLETSDIYDKRTNKYYKYYYDFNGEKKKATVTLTLTMTDFQLIKEHYDLIDFEILDGCYFNSEIGIFDEYIDKYRKIKTESKGAKRTLAKLFLNNLYGKLSSSPNSSFKYAYIREDNSVGFVQVTEAEKKTVYVACGSAITSYSRNFTIRAAQKNYNGKDKKGFAYADTDSIHCDYGIENVKGIKIHDSNFCCWKIESEWKTGWFVRQKTYIEEVIKEDGEECDPHLEIKCAGMPEKSKKLFIDSVKQENLNKENYNDEEWEFVNTKREIEDFDIGLTVMGKLVPKRIRGGIILVDTTYEMR